MKSRPLFAHLILSLLIIIATVQAKAGNAYQLSDKAYISLLTCSPGQAVWAQYGHSAIRVYDPLQQIDIAFNYGIFDFQSKHFVWRFVKGETDYILGAYSTSAFMREYKEENRRVTEQVLNLTKTEKENLWNALCENSLPENRTYRYNFFYDNCATRARKIIERSLEGGVSYDPVTPYTSLRDIVNHYTKGHPWARFGISLVVASPADKPAPYIDQLFAPEMMMEAFATATIHSVQSDRPDSIQSVQGDRPLVERVDHLADTNPSVSFEQFPWPHPLIVFWLLFAIVAFTTWRGYKKKSHSWLCDGLVFAVAGIAGLIVFVMNFFSAHPAVSHNWLLLWLQPLHLLFAVSLILSCSRKSRIPTVYYLINLPFMLFALVGFLFLPQYFDPACLPILLAILCRCLYGLSCLKKSVHSGKIVTACLISILLWIPQQAKAERNKEQKGPALVVGIYLDQVEEDYIRWFMDGMEEDGLKKIFSEGRLYTNVAYNTAHSDDAIVTAGIVTGAPPLFHGIIGDAWLDTKQGTLSSCVLDRDFMGNFTSATCSPQRLLVSTVGDELRDGTMNHSKVYSIGIDPEAAIISGGQKANGVYWLDDETGLWCTSTYYKDMPRWIENLNSINGDNAIPSSWTPRFALGRYQHMPHQRNSLFFSHLIKGGDRGRLFKQTPMANTRVIELAEDLISNERLGEDEYPDMLNIHLNLGNIMGGSDGLSSMEIEDFYFCLDQDIARLISFIDKKLGNDNILYFIAGTGENTYPIDEGKNIKTFSPDRCGVLLNLYLSALHGDGKWVLGQTDRDIYLNHPLIEEKGLIYNDICKEAAELVSQVEGIQQVTITQDFIISHEQSDDNLLHNSFCKGRSGDLMLTIETGRNIVWDSYPTYNRLVRHANTSTFVAFYGNGIRSQQSTLPVSLFDIAPTLCRLLFVRTPTATQGSALFTSQE